MNVWSSINCTLSWILLSALNRSTSYWFYFYRRVGSSCRQKYTYKNNIKNILLRRLKQFLCCRFSFCCCLKKCFCRCRPFCSFCSSLGHRCPESGTTKSTKRETAVKTFLQCRQKIVSTLFTKTNHTKTSKSLNL